MGDEKTDSTAAAQAYSMRTCSNFFVQKPLKNRSHSGPETTWFWNTHNHTLLLGWRVCCELRARAAPCIHVFSLFNHNTHARTHHRCARTRTKRTEELLAARSHVPKRIDLTICTEIVALPAWTYLWWPFVLLTWNGVFRNCLVVGMRTFERAIFLCLFAKNRDTCTSHTQTKWRAATQFWCCTHNLTQIFCKTVKFTARWTRHATVHETQSFTSC